MFYCPNLSGKAGFVHKDDVTHIRSVVLDFDPDYSMPAGEERDKLRLMAWKLVHGVLQPRAIVNTGNGMQVLWQLIEPIDLTGPDRDERVKEHETFLKTLAKYLGADTKTCRVENLFRVPGTINWPTPNKAKHDREKAFASVWFSGGPRTSILELRALCQEWPTAGEEVAHVEFEGLSEHDVLVVLGEPDKLPDSIKALLDANPNLMKAALKVDHDAGDTSGQDHALCMDLAYARVPAHDMALILSAYGEKVHKANNQNRLLSYIQITVRKAIAKAAPAIFDDTVSAEEKRKERSKHIERLKPLSSDEWRQGLFDEPEITLVQGLLMRPSLACVYGRESEGKTFVALDIGWRVSLGLGWLGRKTRSCGVVYLAAEYNRHVRYRLEALTQRHGVSKSFLLIPEQVDLFHPDVDIAPLAKAIANAAADHRTDIGLIIVDTLAMVMVGGDENSTKDMSQLVHNCQRLMAGLDATILLVHHTGKKVNGMRGSTVLPGAIDTGIMVSGSTKFEVTKLRDGGERFTAGFNLRQVTIGKAADGEPVTTCVVDWFSIPSQANGPPRDRDREGVLTVLRMLQNEPSTTAQIIAKAKLENIDMTYDRGNLNRLLRESCDDPTHHFFEKIIDNSGKRPVVRYRLLNW